MDAPVAPVGILIGEADDQTPEDWVDRWTTPSLLWAVGSSAVRQVDRAFAAPSRADNRNVVARRAIHGLLRREGSCGRFREPRASIWRCNTRIWWRSARLSASRESPVATPSRFERERGVRAREAGPQDVDDVDLGVGPKPSGSPGRRLLSGTNRLTKRRKPVASQGRLVRGTHRTVQPAAFASEIQLHRSSGGCWTTMLQNVERAKCWLAPKAEPFVPSVGLGARSIPEPSR